MTATPATHAASPPDPGAETPSLFVAARFAEAFGEMGLTSLDAVFAFNAGQNLAKANIGRFRRRLQFEAVPTGAEAPVRVFLKCYNRPPVFQQLRNWLSHHRRRSFAAVERDAIERLEAAGVNVPRIVACGERWGPLFERRSFLITEEIPHSQSLERRLPPCFDAPDSPDGLLARRDFIRELAEFIRRFHQTGYRHRDLYLSHIFRSDTGEFCLIDLARASRPILRRRFQIKDLAQLHYSAPARHFSRSDRLRFFLSYAGRRRLTTQDKALLRAIQRKTARMTRHNVKHGAVPPFLERAND